MYQSPLSVLSFYTARIRPLQIDRPKHQYQELECVNGEWNLTTRSLNETIQVSLGPSVNQDTDSKRTYVHFSTLDRIGKTCTYLAQAIGQP